MLSLSLVCVPFINELHSAVKEATLVKTFRSTIFGEETDVAVLKKDITLIFCKIFPKGYKPVSVRAALGEDETAVPKGQHSVELIKLLGVGGVSIRSRLD